MVSSFVLPILDLPVVFQREAHDCGVACAVSVLRYFGLSPGFPATSAYLLPTPLDGVDPRTLEWFFRSYGLRVLVGEMDSEDLKQQTMKQGRPVVCAVKNHWVVAAGVKRNYVYYMDPDEGQGNVRKKCLPFQTWWEDHDRLGVAYRQFGLVIWK